MTQAKTKDSAKTGKKPQAGGGLWIDAERLPTSLAKRKRDPTPFAFAAAALSPKPDNDPQSHYLSLAERVLNAGDLLDDDGTEADIPARNTHV